MYTFFATLLTLEQIREEREGSEKKREKSRDVLHVHSNWKNSTGRKVVYLIEIEMSNLTKEVLDSRWKVSRKE